MSDKTECDVSIYIGLLLVFSLPITLLIPGFSVWDVVPKIRVTRFLIISQDFTWNQINVAIVLLLSIFFTFYLEIKKRILDDMVEKVLTINQATDGIVQLEHERQTSAVRASLDLIDASTEHYERLMLLRDELKRRDRMKKQHPPIIELSSEMVQQK